MAMVVKNNMSAINTLNTLNKNQGALGKSLAKVSSGQKINSAQDDASGYAISERMRVMVRALDQATQNTQNGSAMMKVAEGAVANTIEILKTLKEKAINAATDTNTDDDRKTIQKEINQFVDQINDNALATFNGKYLVDGSKASKSEKTATVMTNQSLDFSKFASNWTDTYVTDLCDSSGNSLNIVEGDNVKVSWVIQGKTYSRTFSYDPDGDSGEKEAVTGVGSATKLGEILNIASDVVMFNYVSGKSAKADGSFDSSTGIGKDSSGVWVGTADGQSALTITAATTAGDDDKTAVNLYEDVDAEIRKYSTDTQLGGTTNQISAFVITVTDRDGNAKKSANEFLEFKTAIFATNKNEDHSLKIHVGSQAGQSISVGLSDMRAEALGLQNAKAEVISIVTKDEANAAIAAFDNALAKALDVSTTIGAIEARLEYTANNLSTESENVQSAESTIRDADMAKEMTNYTKNNVLLQAAQSMLAQANQNSSAVLSLLQ